jgi:hypothetical protein
MYDIERRHLCTCCDDMINNNTPDEAGSAGDENMGAFQTQPQRHLIHRVDPMKGW